MDISKIKIDNSVLDVKDTTARSTLQLLGTASVKDAPASGNASNSQVVLGNDTRLSDPRPASDVYEWAKASTKPTYTKSEVGLGNVTNDSQVKRSEMGVASGVATLDSTGKVPSTQLPSYVDDVIEGYMYNGKFYAESTHETQITGESGKIYSDLSTNKIYRWGGSAFAVVSETLAVGTTQGTAFDGKSGYDHVNNTNNPHSVTKSQVGLGNVANTGDSATPVSGGTTKFTTGGAYTELAKKVDKVTGKGLSTNDYTTDEKNKLAGIASGAEVNVQSDWNAESGDAFIKNKPTSMPASDVYSWAKASSKPSYTASEVGLGNVGNFKAVSTVASQGLTDTEKSNARTNIGALSAEDVHLEFEYGIQWTDANTTPTRIGSPNLHRTLPIQSLMRRCIKTVNGFKYISDSDYTKYEDGTIVNYLTDGDLFVHIPKYWYRAYDETVNGTSYHKLMLYTKETAGAKESKEVYIGAVEASSDDASNSTNPALYSIIKANITYNQDGSVSAANLTYPEDAVNYRGGNQRGSSSWDETEEKCCLGRPVTNLTRAAFRQRASRRGTGYSQQYWSAYMAMVRLYVVEYCNFNTQAAYNSAKTSDGYMQGGLGAGISTDYDYGTHNDYNPFVPCGVTLRLGNKTGIVSFASGSAYTGSVPSYRGVENPFAHIWKWTDGINIYTANGVTDVYVTDDITKFADDTATDYEKHVTFTRSFKEGYISKWNWDDNGEFIPTAVGGSDSSYLYDYGWWNNTNVGWRVLCSGGYASRGAECGWFFFYANSGSGDASRDIGGRLYYTPNN